MKKLQMLQQNSPNNYKMSKMVTKWLQNGDKMVTKKLKILIETTQK